MDFPIDEKRVRLAYDAAGKYLSASPRSEKEVKEKLYSKGFHKDEVEGAIEKCKLYHFIDDEAYVRTFLEFYKNKYGAKKLAYKLTTEKGINRELVDNLIADELPDDLELQKAKDCAEKYILQKKFDKKDVSKVAAFLFQRGFEWNIINQALNDIFVEF
ncbi:MAG: regulatory protein RecX [Clostridia bacterium]